MCTHTGTRVFPAGIANTHCSSITGLRDLHAHMHLFSEDQPTAKVRFVTYTICTDVLPLAGFLLISPRNMQSVEITLLPRLREGSI